ncbi:MAG: hypothetical protein J6Z46_11270 [Lachnospiraceae bacterium]|nr:hypothetical protein [Lachnospiraceae bacterium]
MDREKTMLFDRLSFKDLGWLEILTVILLGVLPFFVKRNLDPFPGDELWQEIISVAVFLLCGELYRFGREWIKIFIYRNAGLKVRTDFIKHTYVRVDGPFPSKIFIIAIILSSVVPCLLAGTLIPLLPEFHFWKAYIVIMFALPETIRMGLLLLRDHKSLKNQEVVDEGRYVYLLRDWTT